MPLPPTYKFCSIPALIGLYTKFGTDPNNYIAVYNYSYYKNNNPDLTSLYGDDREAYLNHFVTVGMSEGRQGNKEFNLSIYKANNPDLVSAFGDDNTKYYEHYISTGKAEGRKAA